ncbi:MAG: response regulator transcription factor [Alistipes sp.]|jgi:two-component system LytT family response regulator|nr:response regulator transcription factor [Alistipes sp.]MBR0362572.1 response regulator transcription factor [Alistipes sp.]MBR5551413.1 response regulator transcription factor [Muribaculaceae bacterium]MBR5770460.1 response regulator transcription factor [Alistipes sp.]
MVRCIAIDDEPMALRQIKSYIERTEQLELVAVCRSAMEAQEVLKTATADLLFVDINMPDMNGLEFVRSIDSGHYIVFTTAHPEFALEGFKLNAIDYLLKPFSYEEFMKATQKVISLVDLVERCHAAESAIAQNEAEAADKEVISVKADYKTQLVKVADIVYLESAGEYVRLHIEGSSTITTLFRLKNMETTLPADGFLRVHRSYIVNLKRIASYTKGRIFLDNGEYIPLGENYKERFLEYFNKMNG